MARFYGPVGYVSTVETAPDVSTEIPHERNYVGDLLKNNRRLESSGELNDNIKISNRISIVADPYALDHFFAIRYVKWMGAYWEVTDVEVEYPRLILTLGGVYNGIVWQETPSE